MALDQVFAERNEASNIENLPETRLFRVDGSREPMMVFSSTVSVR
jgi:hypothetical protein